MRVFPLAFGQDGEDPRLDWRKPSRESPAVILGEDADEALNRAKDDPVEHNRLDLLPVLVDVIAAEAMGEVDVKLDGPALPGSVHRVLQLEVELRPVEGPVAGVNLVFVARMLAGSSQNRLAFVPEFLFPDVILGPGRQDDPIAKPKDRVNLVE